MATQRPRSGVRAGAERGEGRARAAGRTQAGRGTPRARQGGPGGANGASRPRAAVAPVPRPAQADREAWVRQPPSHRTPLAERLARPVAVGAGLVALAVVLALVLLGPAPKG